jgi:hypothetical protein
MRWLLVTAVVFAAGVSTLTASAAQPADPCALVTTVDASTALNGNPPKATPKTVGLTRTCTYRVGKKTMTVTTAKIASKIAFDISAKRSPGVVVPMLGTGADAYSVNGKTILVWKSGNSITMAFVGFQPFVSVQQSLVKTVTGRL